MEIQEAEGIIQTQSLALSLLQERLDTLERALPISSGWEILSGSSGNDFTRDKLQTIADLAKVYYLKNPLIKRAVDIQTLYVWGSGYSVVGEAKEVDRVLDKFWTDPKNKPILSHQGLTTLERELRLNANLFFAFFTDSNTGRVIIRTIPFSEMQDIRTDPEDRQEKWFYVRQFSVNGKSKRELYPDWRYQPVSKPASIDGMTVNWDIPVLHIKTNSLSDMLWGVSEVYCAIDWSRGYKEFLEDWLKLVKAHSRFAWNATVKGGASAVAAAKTGLEAMLTPDSNGDYASAGIFVGNQNTQLQPYKFSGATTDVDDSRRYMLMVGSAVGIPEQLLAADPSTANLATSKSLERPSELQFMDRQRLWSDILQDICQYVIDQSVKAPHGILQGEIIEDEYGEEQIVLSGGISRKVSVTFPDIVEHDVNKQILAIIHAATLDGRELAGTMDMKTITRLLLRVLKLDDADDLLAKLFPTDEIVMQRLNKAGQEEDDPQDEPVEDTWESLDREIAKTLNKIQESINVSDSVS